MNKKKLTLNQQLRLVKNNLKNAKLLKQYKKINKLTNEIKALKIEIEKEKKENENRYTKILFQCEKTFNEKLNVIAKESNTYKSEIIRNAVNKYVNNYYRNLSKKNNPDFK